jgi:hypothetical protein
LALAVAAMLAQGCRARPSDTPRNSMTQRSLTDVLAAHSPELMAIPGVTAVAESRLADGRPCVLVLVVKLTPELRGKIPRELEGWPVRLDQSGEIRAQPDSAR